MTQFRDLAIGQGFDFIGPDRAYNSFFLRCTKISPRRYLDERGTEHRVGTINAEVFHVEEREQRFS